MTDRNLKYVILEDAYYTALELSETVKRFRPRCLLVGVADETEEAIRLIRSHHPEMMIADTSSSDGDSISILQEAVVDIPIIFISEYAALIERAKKLNMVDFILKPVTSGALERALDRFDNLRQTNSSDIPKTIGITV